MIQTQTFDFKDNTDELETIARALELLMEKRPADAAKVLVKRHDQLMAQPKLKLYGT